MVMYNEEKDKVNTTSKSTKVSTYSVNPDSEDKDIARLSKGTREKRDPQLKARRHKFDVDFQKWIKYLGYFQTPGGKMKAMEPLDGVDRLKRKLIAHFKLGDYALAHSGINLEAEIILLETQNKIYADDKNISPLDSKKQKDAEIQIAALKRAIKILEDEKVSNKNTNKPEEKNKLSKSEEN